MFTQDKKTNELISIGIPVKTNRYPDAGTMLCNITPVFGQRLLFVGVLKQDNVLNTLDTKCSGKFTLLALKELTYIYINQEIKGLNQEIKGLSSI